MVLEREGYGMGFSCVYAGFQVDLRWALLPDQQECKGLREAPSEILSKHKVGHVLYRREEDLLVSPPPSFLCAPDALDACICVPHCAS